LKNKSHFILIVLATLLWSCSPGPKPIRYGTDMCNYCKMTIVEELYGAEIVTTTGKTYVFDSIECLAASTLKNQIDSTSVFGLYVSDFQPVDDPLINIDNAFFIVSKKLGSPMGLNISATANKKLADDIALMYYGEIMPWSEIQNYVKKNWF